MQKDDAIVVGGREKPIVMRVSAILVTNPLDEIWDSRDRFSSVDAVSATTGVEIVAPDLEGALAGAPSYAVAEREALSEAKAGMQVAISMGKPMVGRHVFEKEVLFVRVLEADAKALLTTFMDKLTAEEQDAPSGCLVIMRKKTPF